MRILNCLTVANDVLYFSVSVSVYVFWDGYDIIVHFSLHSLTHVKT